MFDWCWDGITSRRIRWRFGLGLGMAAVTVMGSSCNAGSTTTGRAVSQTVFFRPVYCERPFVASVGLAPSPKPLSMDSCSSELVDNYASTPRVADRPDSTVLLVDINQDARFVLGPADLRGSDLSGAWVESSGSGYATVLGFTPHGAALFDRVAADRYAAYQRSPSDPAASEAIDVNGEVVSFAAITTGDVDGCVEIVGSNDRGLSNTDASNLADEIRAAAHLTAQPQPQSCSGGSPSFTLVGAVDHPGPRSL